MIHPQFAMPATRNNDDRSSAGFISHGKIGRDRRVMNIRHDVFAVFIYSNDLFSRFSFRARSAVWPQQNGLRLRGRRCGEQCQQNHRETRTPPGKMRGQRSPANCRGRRDESHAPHDPCRAVNKPRARSQLRSNAGHSPVVGSPRSRPTPCAPFSKTCISAGTPAL
jgi:hypothetical protein